MTLETGPRNSPDVNVTSLKAMSVDVGGTSISLLVRDGTFDADIVHEVVRTYQIPGLVKELRRKPTVNIFDVGAHIGAFSAIICSTLPICSVARSLPMPSRWPRGPWNCAKPPAARVFVSRKMNGDATFPCVRCEPGRSRTYSSPAAASAQRTKRRPPFA